MAFSSFSHLFQGLVKPEIRRYSFDQIEQAVRTLQKGDVAGRCVVSFD
jgi:D-arabinose 1-dehydrogenase-like Zn-dependent alcohol dehydrogenase